ncbi:2-phosphosulfolactate phosphatase [Bacteroidales bacterium OttesenSCG-928-I21]|nr:2-phosphosulfolactate phosphatase [Bacteroidales bacterium OttesenSCG-928-I21]
MNKIEVCFVPELFDKYYDKNSVVVVVDVLRATSSICAAFVSGVNKIIPVATAEEAMEYKKKGYIVASEKDGIKRDFADFGNSPHHFSKENIGGKDLVYSTTNGTRTIHQAIGTRGIAIGSFPNLTAVAEWVTKHNCDVVILCAGWKGKFNLEDTLFAGALAELLLQNTDYNTICDSAIASIDLWNVAKENLHEYIKKAAQFTRLNKNGHGDCIEYCITADSTDVVPIFKDDYLELV